MDDLASPAFLGRRQQHFQADVSTLIEFEPDADNEEAGLAAYQSDSHHCQAAITRRGGRRVAMVRRRIGSAIVESIALPVENGPLTLSIAVARDWYIFSLTSQSGRTTELARHESRYLSTEVAGGFVGVMLGIYATARGTESANAAHFDWFEYLPKQ